VEAGEGGANVQIVWPEDALWPQGGYANVMLINQTPFDFTIRLGHFVLPAFPPGQPLPEGPLEVMVTPVAQVTMPPPAFRDFALVIQQQVATYLQNFGEIGGATPGENIG